MAERTDTECVSEGSLYFEGYYKSATHDSIATDYLLRRSLTNL